MKLPRDLLGESLANALEKLGYVVACQTGSHVRLTTQQNGEHHITIPNHSPIKIGTISAILRDVTRDALINQLLYEKFTIYFDLTLNYCLIILKPNDFVPIINCD